MDYKKNQKYFKPVNYKMPVILMVLGVLMNFTILRPVGWLVLIIGIALLVLQVSGRPTDADIDAAVSSQLQNLKQRALKKLGIDEEEVSEIAPITFDGYVYNKAQIARGKDGLYRSNKYQAVMFFFSSSEVHCFTYNFSITESSQKEATDVYFYKDIVSVSTQTDGTEYSVGKGKSSQFDYEYFKLTTTGGTSISCAVRNVDDAQRSINGMRSLIKAKKSV